jgi:tetratricopeptide (TPR) repeat protein
MSPQDANQGVGHLFRTVGGWITSFISFISTLVGFVKLVQGDTDFITGILLIVGIGSLLLICGFIYFKKVTIGESLGLATQRPAYSKTSRRLALTGLFVIPILLILSLASWQWDHSRPPEKIIILIAKFQGPEEKYHFTRKLIEDLSIATEPYEDVAIESLNEVITPEQGGNQVAIQMARAQGKKHKAAIVLWGGYRVLPAALDVDLHIELLPVLKSLHEQAKSKVSAPDNLEFQISLKQTELEEQIVGKSNYAILLTVGLVRYQAGDLDGAIHTFTEALNQSIISEKIPLEVIYLYRGIAYYDLENYLSAIEDYKQALQFNSDLVQAYNNLGNAYAEQGNYKLAIENYDLAIQLQPDDADYFYNRGIARAEQQEYDLAIEDYSQAIQLKSDFAEAYNNLGLAYTHTHQFDLAINSFNRAIKHNSKLAEAHNNRGFVYDKQGQHYRAIKNYNRAIQQNPELLEAYYNRGNVYMNLGNYQRAIQDYTQVIQQNPDFISAYNGRGIIYAQQQDYDLAIADYQTIFTLNPNPDEAAEAHNNLGFTYAQQGQYDRALTHINQAISLRPDFDQAYDSRGFVYSEQGKYDLAIADYNQALQINPDLAITYLNRGNAYKAKGDQEQAMTDFKKVLELTEHPTLRQQAEEQLRVLNP